MKRESRMIRVDNMQRKGIMTSPKSIGTIALFLILTVLPGLAWAAPPAGPGKGRPPVVSVIAVAEQEVNPPAEYVGRVEAIQSVDLRARVQGCLEQVKFKEGSEVQAGDILYLIEQAPYKAKVNEARARAAQNAAALTRAGQYLQRLKTVRSGGVSATDMDAAVSAELEAKAELQEAQAALEQAELNLGYTVITAPITGRIGRSAFTKGNLVGPESGALARIVQLDPIRVVYSVSENDYATAIMNRRNLPPEEISRGLALTLKLSNGELLNTAGRLDFTDNQVDASVGAIAVRAVFDNPDNILLPGQYVTVQVSLSKARRMPVIPQAAVLEDREGRYVFVVDGEKRVQQRRIKTGVVLNAFWAVESGLTAGETIIVQGVQKVSPGLTVETVNDGEQPKE
jgi:membrane fusion protein (multidrug efflux system)